MNMYIRQVISEYLPNEENCDEHVKLVVQDSFKQLRLDVYVPLDVLFETFDNALTNCSRFLSLQ